MKSAHGPVRTAAPARAERAGLAVRILEAAPDAMVVCRSDGGIERANKEAQRLFGYRQRELAGMRVEDLVPDAQEKVREDLREAIHRVCAGERGMRGQIEVRSKRGEQLPVEVALSPMRIRGGRHFVATLRDLRQTRRMEQRLQRRTEQLEGLNRELEGFADCVSHDLRSPLVTLGMFSDLLVRTYWDQVGEDAGRLLLHMRDAAHHMSELLEGLHLLGQATSAPLVRSSVDLVPLARRIAQRLEDREPGGPSLVVPTALVVDADPGLMAVLLENLLGNAWKYAHGQDTTVKLGRHKGWIVVRDNGPGFPPDRAEDLFRPFCRLHTGPIQGRGIGLATVQRIVRRHGGDIQAFSDHGAVFAFTLGSPVAPLPRTVASRSDRRAGSSGRNRRAVRRELGAKEGDAVPEHAVADRSRASGGL